MGRQNSAARLQLRRETLRCLAPAALGAVVGGRRPAVDEPSPKGFWFTTEFHDYQLGSKYEPDWQGRTASKYCVSGDY